MDGTEVCLINIQRSRKSVYKYHDQDHDHDQIIVVIIVIIMLLACRTSPYVALRTYTSEHPLPYPSSLAYHYYDDCYIMPSVAGAAYTRLFPL